MARTGDLDAHAGHDHGDVGLDDDLVASCIGMGDKFPHIWEIANRYVRRGDGIFVNAGLALVREFTYRLPFLEAAELIEWYFERSAYAPRTGNGPILEREAFRAAVAVGLISDYLGEDSTDAERRVRMMAVVAKALAVASSARDRSLVERAFRALDERNADWWTSPSSRHDAVLGGRRMDPELVERCIEPFEDGRNDEAIRSAMIVLEQRLRTSANLPATDYGDRLVQKAIGPNADLNFGQTENERRGLTAFFTSALSFFRNPNAHQFIEHDAARTIEVLSVVDLALDLLAEANTQLHQPANYMTPKEEGEGLRVERVLHIDLDGDGYDERLLVCSHGPSEFRRLAYLLLKQVDGEWLRLPIAPSDPEYGFSDDERLLALYEADIANDGTKQAVIVAASAAGGDFATMHILRWRDGGAGWLTCAQDGTGAFGHQEVMFEIAAGMPDLRDVDGDRHPEIYVRRATLLDPYRNPVTVSYLEVFAYEPQRSCLVVRDRKPLGDQPISSTAYEFIQELTARTTPGTDGSLATDG